MLTEQSKKELNDLECRLVEVLEREQFDTIEGLAISATHGWINCLLNYDIEPKPDDLEKLESEIKIFEESF